MVCGRSVLVRGLGVWLLLIPLGGSLLVVLRVFAVLFPSMALGGGLGFFYQT